MTVPVLASAVAALRKKHSGAELMLAVAAASNEHQPDEHSADRVVGNFVAVADAVAAVAVAASSQVVSAQPSQRVMPEAETGLESPTAPVEALGTVQAVSGPGPAGAGMPPTPDKEWSRNLSSAVEAAAQALLGRAESGAVSQSVEGSEIAAVLFPPCTSLGWRHLRHLPPA